MRMMHLMRALIIASIATLFFVDCACADSLTTQQRALLTGARLRIGDKYDSSYYAGGPPPKGRGACTEVLYSALLLIGVNLQDEVDKDIIKYPHLYPYVRDRNIDYRWCPNLMVWFNGYSKSHTLKADKKSLAAWRAGDVVFWSWSDDHVADHCGIISDKKSAAGVPLVIHNLGPSCKENNVLRRWEIVGHFRY